MTNRNPEEIQEMISEIAAYAAKHGDKPTAATNAIADYNQTGNGAALSFSILAKVTRNRITAMQWEPRRKNHDELVAELARIAEIAETVSRTFLAERGMI